MGYFVLIYLVVGAMACIKLESWLTAQMVEFHHKFPEWDSMLYRRVIFISTYTLLFLGWGLVPFLWVYEILQGQEDGPSE